MVFENAFRSWLNRRSDRFLLTGAELKKVLKHGDRLFGGAVLPEKFAFLQRSRRKRNERRLYASGILLGVVTIGTLLWLEVNVFEPKKQVAQNIHQLETADLKGRLDAIARLTKLAQDHEDVAPDVLNRLAAYVREHARWKEGITSTSIAQDVQDALSDIGRIRKSDSRGKPFDPVDLHNVDISWATLEYANLERVVLWGSNLVHVDLAWANLNHADVGGVDFTDASLEHAHLDGALCPPSVYASPKRGCIFQRTHFYDASLKGTRLEGADLRRAIDLSQEQLKEAIINHDTRLPDYLSPNKPGGSQ